MVSRRRDLVLDPAAPLSHGAWGKPFLFLGLFPLKSGGGSRITAREPKEVGLWRILWHMASHGEEQ